MFRAILRVFKNMIMVLKYYNQRDNGKVLLIAIIMK